MTLNGVSLALQNSRDSSFWPAYQQRWAALLCDKTEGLHAWIERTIHALAQGEMEVSDIFQARAALEDLSARLKRAESLREDDQDALDEAVKTHYLRYGAAILSEVANAPAEPLRYGEVRASLEQLKSWLSVMELSPTVVLSVSDRDSQIIARALALRLKLRYESASGDDLAQSEALIVTADSRSIKASALATIFPEQVVFAFNLHPAGGTLAPDVAGRALAAPVFPWHLENGEDEDGEPVPPREASSVAAQIAATRATPDAGWPARLEWYRAHSSLLAAGNPRFSRVLMLPEGL